MARVMHLFATTTAEQVLALGKWAIGADVTEEERIAAEERNAAAARPARPAR